MQRKLGLCIATSLILVTLSGCSTLQINGAAQAKEKVSKYNNLVSSTLSDYASSKSLATKGKEKLLSFITSDKTNSVVPSKIASETKKLTPKELMNIQDYVVAYDNYFTALGATGVREVLILDASTYKLYATVLWNSKGVYALSRTVVNSQ